MDILETTRLPGAEEVDHPMRFRLKARRQHGVAEPAVRDYLDDPARVRGYGPDRTTGFITYQGEVHRVDSRSFGNALFSSRR